MLATLVAEPFHKTGWVYEEKYDGDRTLAYKKDGRVRLLSRRAIDRKQGFPHIVAAIRDVRSPTLVLDGEILFRQDVRGPRNARVGADPPGTGCE
jgi:bifunctional non-homologous end joining protein LigD